MLRFRPRIWVRSVLCKKYGRFPLYTLFIVLTIILVTWALTFNQAQHSERGLILRSGSKVDLMYDYLKDYDTNLLPQRDENIIDYESKKTAHVPKLNPKATHETYNIVWDTSLKHTDRILEQLRYVPENIDTLATMTILISDMVGGEVIPEGNELFKRDECLVNNCQIKYRGPNPDHADAVISSTGSIPAWAWDERSPEDVWIYYMLESPLVTTVEDPVKGIFNWTATYRQDSTIVAPYGKWVPSQPINDLEWRLGQDGSDGKLTKNYAGGKSKLVAAVISKCNVEHRRAILWELGKYMKVDVYGMCGTPCGRSSECFDMLQRNYKFYLAFENANCHDYITEKLYRNAFSYEIVPVVFGAPPEDYARVAPPLSYIHVEHFPSMKHLAEYLKLVGDNDELYNSYFRWKGQGEFINTKFWCRLCAMLNDRDKPRKIIEDAHEWWYKQAYCLGAAD